MTKSLALAQSNVIPIDAGCAEPALPFSHRMIQALHGTLRHLLEQVPDGRTITYVVVQVCEDGRSLIAFAHFDGNEDSYCDIAAAVNGIEYDRNDPLTHPRVIVQGLRWLGAMDAHD